MKWISVEDKLPKDILELDPCDWVLIIDENRVKNFGRCIETEWRIDSEFGYFSDCGKWPFDESKITHWMPLDLPETIKESK